MRKIKERRTENINDEIKTERARNRERRKIEKRKKGSNKSAEKRKDDD